MRRMLHSLTFLAMLCHAAPSGVPLLRHLNYMAVMPVDGGELKLECIAHGYQDYRNRLRVRVVSDRGEVTEGAEIAIGASGLLPLAACPLAAVELNSGRNLVRVTDVDAIPHAYRSGVRKPLQTVREWMPLHFFVPKGTTYFNIWIHAPVRGEGLRYELRGPAGDLVRTEEGDFDKRTKVQTRVAKGADGKAWSLALLKPKTKGIYTDDVAIELGRHLPPFLAPRPEWARTFAGDWAFDPKAPSVRRRFEAAASTVSTYHGTPSPELDAAYARRGAPHWRTSLPVTYVLDYGAKHLGNPDYTPMVAKAPPTLLHLGKDVPFNHGWGPVKALGGENQAYGHGDAIIRLPPGQVGERITGLQDMVAKLHNDGVRWVVPYICGMTVNGDPARRSGFWEFYDHWDEYRSLGLAEKPATDPIEWLQTDATGKPRIYYGYKYPDEYYPPFKNNHRFAACWHAEGWRTWLTEVVRFIARSGCDGIFVDNGTSQRSTSKHALKAFRGYLGNRFTPEQAQELLGVQRLSEATFPKKSGNLLLRVEQTRFWTETIRGQMAALRQAGSKELGRDFLIFPNGGRPGYIQAALRDTDFVMFEKSHGDFGTHPGMAISPVFEGVSLNTYNDNIYEYKVVQGLRERVRTAILSRPGYPSRLSWAMLNRECARLGLAECAAFSGGGAFLFRPRFDVYGDALNEYRRFFETHTVLYAGLLPHAPTALLAGLEETWYGNSRHKEHLRTATRAFSDDHILFEIVAERRLKTEQLEDYENLVSCGLRTLSDAQLSAILRRVSAGATLLVCDDFATRDDMLRERTGGLAKRIAALSVGGAIEHGKGRILRLADGKEIAQRLPAIRVSCTDKTLAAQLRVNAFRTPATDRVVLHIVNYNVPLGVKPPPAPAIGAVDVSMPLPSGFQPTSATLHAPDRAKPESIPLVCADGRAAFRLPEQRIYSIVELR